MKGKLLGAAAALLSSCTLAPEAGTPDPGQSKIDNSIAKECTAPTIRVVFSAAAGDMASEAVDGGRTSSLDAEFSIGCAAGDLTEQSTSNVKATLRSSAGTVIEQWLLNDPRPSHSLNEKSCDTKQAYPQCWLFAPDDLDEDGALRASLPTWSAEAAALLDPQGKKPTVGGDVELALGADEDGLVDGRAIFRWRAPLGLDKSRIQLHVDSLHVAGGGGDIDTFAIYRLRWVGDGPDVHHPVVEILEQNDQDLVLGVDVRALSEAVVAAWDDDGCVFRTRELLVEGESMRWTFTNEGVEAATIVNMALVWHTSQGALLEARVDDAVLWQGVRQPPAVTLNEGWSAVGPERTVEPGEDLSIELLFEHEADDTWTPSNLRIDLAFAEGCATQLRPEKLPPEALVFH